jgi:nitroreductase
LLDQTGTGELPGAENPRLFSGWWDWIFVLILVGVATFLRFYLIGQVPPGLNSDEAVGAVGGLKTLREGPQLFYEGQGGGGPIGFYFVAATFALLGATVVAARSLVATVSVIAVAVTYALFREMFRQEGRLKARAIAALAALGLATSFWHVSVSRIAFAGGGVLLLEVCAFYFLWRGLRTGGRGSFIASAVFVALSMYTYLAGNFLLVALALFFGVQWVVARVALDPENPPLLEKYFRSLLLMAIVVLVLIIPLVYFFLRYPDIALERVNQASITSPLINQGDLWGTLVRSVTGNFAAFGLTAAWFSGVPSGLLLHPALSILLLTGLLICIIRIRHPNYLFNLVWWPVMLLPSILSPDIIPHTLRASGALPATYIFPAIALVAIVTLPSRLRLIRGRALAASTWAIALLAVATLAYSLGPYFYSLYQHYFLVWPGTKQAQAEYHVYAVRLAEEMNKETNPQAVFVLPLDTSAGSTSPNYTVEFFYRGPAGHTWLRDDETTLAQELTQAVHGRDVVHVIRWKAYKHTAADPKGVLPFLLQQHGSYVEVREFSDYDIATYKLRSLAEEFTTSPPFYSAEVPFGRQMRLVGYAYGDASGTGPLVGQPVPEAQRRVEVPSGELVWVVLRWRKEGTSEEDYKGSVILEDEGGHIVGQADKLLLSNLLHQGTSAWKAGQEEQEYYLLRVAPATVPGRYHLKVVIYEADSGRRLEPPGVGGDLAVVIGDLEVHPGIRPVEVAQLAVQNPGEAVIGNEVRFLGYDVWRKGGEGAVRPGERVSLAFYWQAMEKPHRDYGVQLWLAALGGDLYPQRSGGWTAIGPAHSLAGGLYPTSRWQADEVLRSWEELPVPAEAQTGEYGLELRVVDMASGEVAGKIPLGTVKVAGRPRLFEAPAIGHPLEANLGGKVKLLGYDLGSPFKVHSSRFVITLYWQALTQMDESYTVFVHLLGGGGKVVAQRDSLPMGGEAPTTGWIEGEVIVDPYELSLPKDLSSGEYLLEVGMYDAATGERLPVINRQGVLLGDRVLIEEINE